MPLPVRKSPRLPCFDYTTPTAYFITICTHEKACIFGSPGRLNALGKYAQDAMRSIPQHFTGVTVENSVVMPNHVHMLLLLPNDVQQKISISGVVGAYKAAVSRQIHEHMPDLNV